MDQTKLKKKFVNFLSVIISLPLLKLSFLEDRRDYIQGKIDKWKQKEGSTCDDIIFTNGIREITFDEWIKLEYK